MASLRSSKLYLRQSYEFRSARKVARLLSLQSAANAAPPVSVENKQTAKKCVSFAKKKATSSKQHSKMSTLLQITTNAHATLKSQKSKCFLDLYHAWQARTVAHRLRPRCLAIVVAHPWPFFERSKRKAYTFCLS